MSKWDSMECKDFRHWMCRFKYCRCTCHLQSSELTMIELSKPSFGRVRIYATSASQVGCLPLPTHRFTGYHSPLKALSKRRAGAALGVWPVMIANASQRSSYHG